MRTALAVLVMGTLLAAGCGAAPRAAEPQRRAAATPPALTVYEVEGSGFSIGVPRGWRIFDREHPPSDKFIARYARNDPRFASSLEALRLSVSPFHLFAYEKSGKDALAMNVLALPVRDDDAFREFQQGAIDGARELVGLEGLTLTTAVLPAGRALKLTYAHDALVGGACVCLSATQYVLQSHGTAYILTYITLADRLAAHEDDFDRSARSFVTA